MRVSENFKIDNVSRIKGQLLDWSKQFNEVVWLDSNGYKHAYGNFDAILAVDAISTLSINSIGAFSQLKKFQSETKDWLFGYLNYDLKNEVENLTSSNFDGLGFSQIFMFQPKKIFFISKEEVKVVYLSAFKKEIHTDWKNINHWDETTFTKKPINSSIKARISKSQYLDKVQTILSHIHRGDIYEANFCQEFYIENTKINPLKVYKCLNRISKPPFASYVKSIDKYILSASPERYLAKRGDTVISQPIKGTAKRSMDIVEDVLLKTNLKTNTKERSENIMIVDLVRNDLSQTAIKGTVKVNELCEVYSFDQVHQMISTVSSKVSNSIHPVEIIKSTFPMGSMTGAPKVSAMRIIENLEETKRGVYSGAVGYISPSNDFDFNVIIRSILYNDTNKYVSYSVGSAITSMSDPNLEYEECLVKANAMRLALEQV